ncbi:MAG: SpoIIE family protein phosphatase, partial [Bacteroidales bacterium]|nr:SpoIIE family protein phosphatase [Bacteroidales bacterium]
MVKPYKNAFSTLTSRKGQLIAAPPETLSFEKSLRYESDIYRTGWKISVTIPEDELYGHIKKISTLVLFLQILGLMLLILIIQWTAREQIKLENISASREKIEEELKIARGIQMAMIPKVFPPYPERKDIDIYASILPAKEVGGDLYDFYIRDEKLYFCIGDVSGKGVPASLVMAVTRSLFRTVSAHENSPGHIVTSLNESMSEMNENNMFVTFFCGVLDLRNGNLRYCNAGHNAPVI